MGAPLARVEKVYAAPKPIGKLTVVYDEPVPAKGHELTVACDLFDRKVPNAGLADLPRPDWGSFHTFYSLTDFVGNPDPYLYVQVNLHGPPGVAWERTWALFFFDEDGKLTRQIKRFVPKPGGKVTHVLWEEWPIGSGLSAVDVLKAAGKK